MPPRIDKLPFPQQLQADFTHSDPTVVDAYTLCRIAEDAIGDPIIQDYWPPRNETTKLKLIHVRILGHLLSHSGFLSDIALSAVASDILRCRGQGADEADVVKLNDMGEFYKNHLLRPFRKYKGRTPQIASHPSEPSFRLTKEEVSQMVFMTPRNYHESRNQATIREDYRCIATRILDKTYARTLRIAGPMVGEYVEALECCHIFAESIDTDIDGCENRWTLLKRLGYDDVVSHFATSNKIHSLENVMMVTRRVHDDIDTLDLWFEPIEVRLFNSALMHLYSTADKDVPNRYRMCSIWTLPYGLRDGHEVTFQPADPRLPLPNPDYLAIHAICCRVSHLSGASGLFAELEKDLEANPDPTIQATEFARALSARLENLHLTLVKHH